MMQRLIASAAAALLVTVAACGKKPAVAPGGPDPFPGAGGAGGSTGVITPPGPPNPVTVPPDPTMTSASLDDPFAGKTPDDINDPALSPLKPVYFEYDSDTLSDAARKTLEENAQVLKKYGTWAITIEGHCDERGTSEYNLALGDRRALAAKNYLQTLGVPASRLNTVSYGKEFPFDPGHAETSWTQNRRAHFMVTAVK